jgi:hypothetical protein
MMVIGEQVFPIDLAITFIEFFFLIGECILSWLAIRKINKRQSAVYYLRNTSTRIITNENKIKTSGEIEEEVFYHFPHLRGMKTSQAFYQKPKFN